MQNKAIRRRKKLLKEQGNFCFYCTKKLNAENSTLDHVIAKSHGGGNWCENLVVCCKRINQFFGNMTPKGKMKCILFDEAPICQLPYT